MSKRSLIIVFILFIVLNISTISQIIGGADPPKWFFSGSFVEYSFYGFFSANPPIHNISEYRAVGVVKYTFAEFIDDKILSRYLVKDLNDTRGVFRMIGYKGLAIDVNISLNARFNGSVVSVILDPDTLPEDGHISYADVKVKDSKIWRLRINAVYDKDTGIMVKYEAINDINDTKTGSRIIYLFKYVLSDTNIDQLSKYIHRTTTTTTTEIPSTTHTTEATNKKKENSSNYFNTMTPIIAGMLAFLILLTVYNFVKKK